MKVPTLACVWSPTLIDSHGLLSTLSWFKFWWKMMKVFAVWPLISSQLSRNSCSFRLTGHESWENSDTNLASHQLSSSFDLAFRCQMRMTVDSCWQARVCMRVFSTIVLRSNKNNSCVTVDESWLDITGQTRRIINWIHPIKTHGERLGASLQHSSTLINSVPRVTAI
jgi:hypothetical protein